MDSPEDFTQHLAVISLFRRHTPNFDDRLCAWCNKAGFQIQPGWTTNTILTMLDDARLKKLGATLRKQLFKGLPVKED